MLDLKDLVWEICPTISLPRLEAREELLSHFALFSAFTNSVTAASELLISPWKNLVTTSW
jgi:hypothetical protein